ncbi:MAG: hypothetical protein LBI15_11470 [Dysgonamonadaceae bacterium]|jgi:hypothetical protein|nr:hypothetical protein [Dysgonamonadaceae bacterium]
MRKLLLTAILACTFVFFANAQSFTRFSAGIDAGTYGGGVWGATNLTDNFMLRAGFNYFGFNMSSELDATMDGFVRGTNTPVNDVNTSFGYPQLRMPHGRVMVDWYPAPNGIFSLTLGTYLGAFNINIDGQVKDYERLVAEHGGQLTFEEFGVSLNPRNDGSFDGKLRLGNAIKPYFGIGLGRSIPKNRIGFRFDLGVAYQGNWKFISDQASIDNVRDQIDGQEVPDDLGFINTVLDLAKFWPVLNFSLSYKF